MLAVYLVSAQHGCPQCRHREERLECSIGIARIAHVAKASRGRVILRMSGNDANVKPLTALVARELYAS